MIEWAFSATDAIIDGLILASIITWLGNRQAKKDQEYIEQQLDELYNKLEKLEQEERKSNQ